MPSMGNILRIWLFSFPKAKPQKSAVLRGAIVVTGEAGRSTEAATWVQRKNLPWIQGAVVVWGSRFKMEENVH